MILTALHPVVGGHVLAREAGVAWFVEGALPGEVVEVVPTGGGKGHRFAATVRVVEPSPHRVVPPCPLVGACGGCRLQHASHSHQLEMKVAALRDVLRRVGRLKPGAVEAVPSAPFGYRFRGTFRMGPSGPAFRREGSREEVPVERCLLMDGAIGGLLPALRALPRLGPDDVRLATNGRETVLSFASRRAAPADEAALLDAGAAGVRFADRQAGAGRIGLPLPEGVTISVSAGSFFQANWPANVRLAERVSGLLRARGAARVLDLYAGAGNFSLPLAAAGFEATAVEGGEESFRDLERNVAALGTRRCRAVRSAVERFRPSGRYDAVLLDPPRAGLSPKARALVRNIGAPTVAYVSCDPATLARDLAALSDRYDLESVEMPDFFPQTRHIESLAVLSARR